MLVHALAHDTVDGEAQRPLGHLSLLRQEGRVGEVDATGVVRRGGGGETFPGLAVGRARPVAHEAGVGGEHPHLAPVADPAVEVADHERAALVDGQDRRAYLEVERHRITSEPHCRRRRRPTLSPPVRRSRRREQAAARNRFSTVRRSEVQCLM